MDLKTEIIMQELQKAMLKEYARKNEWIHGRGQYVVSDITSLIRYLHVLPQMKFIHTQKHWDDDYNTLVYADEVVTVDKLVRLIINSSTIQETYIKLDTEYDESFNK